MGEGDLLGGGRVDEPTAGVAAEDDGEAGFGVVDDQQGGAARGERR